MNRRAVRVIYPPHTEGKPWVVRLEYPPLNLHVEGEGVSCAEAQAAAMEQLEKDVAAREQSPA